MDIGPSSVRGTSVLAVALLFTGALSSGGAQRGQQPSAPQRLVARSPRVALSTRHDVSRALRDVAPRPPVRDRVEHEMRKPRPMRGQPSRPGKAVPDPVVQSSPAPANMPSSSQNFEGVGNVNGVLPPDTNGAVGPNHYVQWVNLSFAIYDKSGTLLYGPADGSTLWTGFGGACEFSNDGDPVVLHDDLADRWVMSQLAIPYFPFGPFYQCIAISQTPDPTGAFYRYEFVISDTKLNDYPKLGVWPDAYYLAVNQFDALTSAFQGQGVVAFEREKMLAGLPAGMVYFDLFDLDPNLGGMLPSHLEGAAPPPGSPNIFVLFDDDGLGTAPQDQLQLWSFHVDWTNPSASTFSGPTILPTAPFDSNLCSYARNCIPQSGTTRKVDAISDRLMYRLQYRNFGDHETLVVNHTVDVGGDHAGIRWYEIRDPLGTPTIFQQGTYAPDAAHRWMGSLAMDGAGNMALGFSSSSSTSFPSIRYAGRLASDPPGTMAQGESVLIAGSGSQTDSTGRWGDYSAMTVDPSDQCTFWYTQEYYAATSGSGWRTRIGSFAFPSCSTNLPIVTIVATTPNATEAGPTNGVFTVSRTGSTAAALIVNFDVTGSATAGSDYVSLGQTLTIPAGSATATIVVTPINDSLVEPDETVAVTLRLDPAYAVGTPSSAIVVIISDDVPADLQVSALTAPISVGAGVPFSVTDTTWNSGGGSAGASTTRFYLSANSLLDASDIQVGERNVSALAPGASDSASTIVTIPAGTAAGSYYLLAQADANDAIGETSETNNVRWVNLTVGPDLQVSALTAPISVGAGVPFSVTDSTRNFGGGSAGASVTRFYLSANSLLDAGDVQIGERNVSALAVGATDSASTTVTIPASTATGSYYLLAKADANDAISETSETNNVRWVNLTVGPDLQVSALTAPISVGAGVPFSVTDTTWNSGGGSAGASITRFYLSANSLLDAGDIQIGERSVSTLAPGATGSASTTVTIPASTATGSYYLLAKADANDAVAETSETNNVRWVNITIGPDLQVSALTAPISVGAGVPFSVTDTTWNSGGGSAGASVTRFYLSANSLLDASDVPIGERSVSTLGSGATNSASTTVTIPAGTANGSYYLLAKADANDAIAETSETNNVRWVNLTVGPDLQVSALTAPISVGVGVPFSVTDTTLNSGGGSAGASVTRFYLSTNSLLDASDVPVGERNVSTLAPGATASASTTLTIPAGTATGSYYLLAKADANDAIAETSETNNVRYVNLSVGPDLQVSALTAPASAGPGVPFSVTDTTQNAGGGSAGASTTRFYLSTNSLFDASDIQVGERSVSALAAGATSSASTTLTIPAGTATGSYYLLARADANDAITETSETNNVRYVNLFVGPDLQVTALTAPLSAGAGLPFSVTDSTKNFGGSAGASVTRFYLSANSLLDAGDVPVGERNVPALAAGATDSASTTLTIPAGTATGSYYLLAKADANDAIAETSETNNVRWVNLTVGPDLQVSALTAPISVGAGVPFSVTDTTWNAGGGSAGATVTRFYLSINSLLDAGDVQIGERSVAALAPGATDSASTTVTIPAGTATGSYYLLAKADANDSIVETTETNNVRWVNLTVGPDLQVSALTAPISVGAGVPFSVTDSTRNFGGGSAGATVTRFYLSANSLLDAGDIQIGERSVSVLAPSATDSASTTLTIPAGTATGSYYLLAKADANDAIAETTETNNVRWVNITVGPDLQVSALTAPISVGAGVPFSVTDTTRNFGGGSAGTSTTRFYLSTNSLLDAADVPLGERSVASLAPSATDTGSVTLTIPAGTAVGGYYLLAKADANDAIAEITETNNVRWVNISVTTSSADAGTINLNRQLWAANGIERSWLGGLDSNQDNQIQSLMSYRLNDLPAEGTNRSWNQPRGARKTGST